MNLVISLLLCSIIFSATVKGEELTAPQKEAMEKFLAESKKSIEDETIEKQGQRKFAGLDFGVGISVTFDTGNHDRVQNAEIVDGVVRVTKETNAIARIMLESHYFFTPDNFLGIQANVDASGENKKTFGIGPFMALQPGTKEIIEAIGFGIMVGWRRDGAGPGSWNLGIGGVVDPNVQILGDGFVANEPPPGSETQVRYKVQDQRGWLFLASFSF